MASLNSTRGSRPIASLINGAETLHAIEAERLAHAFSRVVEVDVGQIVVEQGCGIKNIHLIIDGFLVRHKDARQGRQITSVLIQGDFCDIYGLFFPRIDYSVTALSACTLGVCDGDSMSQLLAESTALARLLWQSTLTDAAIGREWIFNVGRRTPTEQVAHLLSETVIRLDHVVPGDRGVVVLPITDTILSQSIGRSEDEVGAAVASLAAKDILERAEDGLRILDRDALWQEGAFDPDYLGTASRDGLAQEKVG